MKNCNLGGDQNVNRKEMTEGYNDNEENTKINEADRLSRTILIDEHEEKECTDSNGMCGYSK